MKNTVELLVYVDYANQILAGEGITKEDIEQMPELLPELSMHIDIIKSWFEGKLSKSTPGYQERGPISKEPEYNEPRYQTSRKLVKMTKIEAEAASKYIAQKCRGRADLYIVAQEVSTYMNNKFSPKTLYSLITGRTHATSSQGYFKIEKGKIKAV